MVVGTPSTWPSLQFPTSYTSRHRMTANNHFDQAGAGFFTCDSVRLSQGQTAPATILPDQPAGRLVERIQTFVDPPEEPDSQRHSAAVASEAFGGRMGSPSEDVRNPRHRIPNICNPCPPVPKVLTSRQRVKPSVSANAAITAGRHEARKPATSHHPPWN